MKTSELKLIIKDLIEEVYNSDKQVDHTPLSEYYNNDDEFESEDDRLNNGKLNDSKLGLLNLNLLKKKIINQLKLSGISHKGVELNVSDDDVPMITINIKSPGDSTNIKNLTNIRKIIPVDSKVSEVKIKYSEDGAVKIKTEGTPYPDYEMQFHYDMNVYERIVDVIQRLKHLK